MPVLRLLSLTVLVTACTACASSHHAAVNDPPVLVPWQQVGDISLGEPQRQVFVEYGGVGHGYHLLDRITGGLQGYYRLHGREVDVEFTNGRVIDIGFATRYYRTKGGFGVGSRIPLGPCVKTWTHRCGHRWHGFVWNEVYKEQVCGCWAKVGTGKQSLRPLVSNFERRWILIYVLHRRVTGFYLSLHYVD